jgi:hypothetical protein
MRTLPWLTLTALLGLAAAQEPSTSRVERGKNYRVALIRYATYFPAAAKPNGTEESIKLTLTEWRLREALATGYTMQQVVIAGNRKGDLRVAIQDRNTAAAGQSNPKNGQ